MLIILHPDAAVRKSLCQSIEMAWPGVTCMPYAPVDMPADIPEHHLVLTAEMLPGLPDGRTILLDRPRRQSNLLIEIAQRIRQSQMPAILELINDQGSYCLNTRTREWHEKNNPSVELTEKEIAMILYLHQRRNAATREDLLRDVWLYAADADTHTVETHMYRLRQKIEKDPGDPAIIVTQEDGYRLAVRAKA